MILLIFSFSKIMSNHKCYYPKWVYGMNIRITHIDVTSFSNIWRFNPQLKRGQQYLGALVAVVRPFRYIYYGIIMIIRVKIKITPLMNQCNLSVLHAMRYAPVWSQTPRFNHLSYVCAWLLSIYRCL